MKIAQLSIFLPDSLWIIGPEEGKNDMKIFQRFITSRRKK
jgi:hypothetical protein